MLLFGLGFFFGVLVSLGVVIACLHRLLMGYWPWRL